MLLVVYVGVLICRPDRSHLYSNSYSENLNNIFFNKKTRIMIRKLKSGQYRLYSRKKDPNTNKRKNLGTFNTLEAAKKHEAAVQYFKHH
jgi:hypothetical protein